MLLLYIRIFSSRRRFDAIGQHSEAALPPVHRAHLLLAAQVQPLHQPDGRPHTAGRRLRGVRVRVPRAVSGAGPRHVPRAPRSDQATFG